MLKGWFSEFFSWSVGTLAKYFFIHLLVKLKLLFNKASCSVLGQPVKYNQVFRERKRQLNVPTSYWNCMEKIGLAGSHKMSETEQEENWVGIAGWGFNTRKALSLGGESRRPSLSGPFLFPSLPSFLPSIQIEQGADRGNPTTGLCSGHSFHNLLSSSDGNAGPFSATRPLLCFTPPYQRAKSTPFTSFIVIIAHF